MFDLVYKIKVIVFNIYIFYIEILHLLKKIVFQLLFCPHLFSFLTYTLGISVVFHVAGIVDCTFSVAPI